MTSLILLSTDISKRKVDRLNIFLQKIRQKRERGLTEQIGQYEISLKNAEPTTIADRSARGAAPAQLFVGWRNVEHVQTRRHTDFYRKH